LSYTGLYISNKITNNILIGFGMSGYKKKCPKCDGTGKQKCSFCKGLGNEIECPNCFGTGRLSWGRQCIRCNATGHLNQDCEFCYGTGVEYCDFCMGTGKISPVKFYICGFFTGLKIIFMLTVLAYIMLFFSGFNIVLTVILCMLLAPCLIVLNSILFNERIWAFLIILFIGGCIYHAGSIENKSNSDSVQFKKPKTGIVKNTAMHQKDKFSLSNEDIKFLHADFENGKQVNHEKEIGHLANVTYEKAYEAPNYEDNQYTDMAKITAKRKLI
jgi:hypothetical protein